jgi:hypothetical protein
VIEQKVGKCALFRCLVYFFADSDQPRAVEIRYIHYWPHIAKSLDALLFVEALFFKLFGGSFDQSRRQRIRNRHWWSRRHDYAATGEMASLKLLPAAAWTQVVASNLHSTALYHKGEQRAKIVIIHAGRPSQLIFRKCPSRYPFGESVGQNKMPNWASSVQNTEIMWRSNGHHAEVGIMAKLMQSGCRQVLRSVTVLGTRPQSLPD